MCADPARAAVTASVVEDDEDASKPSRSTYDAVKQGVALTVFE